MSTPPIPQGIPPEIAQQFLLRWMTSYKDVSPMVRICRVELALGPLNIGVNASPEDMERLGTDLVNLARRAKVDLAQAPNLQGLPPLNGQRPEGG